MILDKLLTNILDERVYQRQKWGEGENHSLAEWILILEQRLAVAKNRLLLGLDATQEIRNIAAVAVACGEQHGFPERKSEK